jgi:hypothetical protein
VLGLGLIAESLLLVRVRAARRAQVLLAYSAAAVVVAIAVITAGGNLVTGSRPARSEVLTRSMAAAGTWLKRHNNGGTIISTPEFNRGITNRAVLALGDYTGLQSYPKARILHPRSLPTAGRRPLLDSQAVLLSPATCRAARIVADDQVRYIFLYRFGNEADYAGFRSDPALYRRVFENSSVVIYAATPQSAAGNCARAAAATIARQS